MAQFWQFLRLRDNIRVGFKYLLIILLNYLGMFLIGKKITRPEIGQFYSIKLMVNGLFNKTSVI